MCTKTSNIFTVTVASSALLIFAFTSATAFGQDHPSEHPSEHPQQPEHPTTQPEHPAGQEHPAQAAELSAQQEWLKQLVGEWDAEFKMFMDPEQPPMEATGSENVRAIGNHWVVSETKTTVFGQPFAGILSLGWDAQKEQYVATWIDSMSGHLWTYKGTMNEEGDTLTLETKGPSMEGPDVMANYKEVIKITGDDTRTFASNIQMEDGSWMTIMTAEYTRKK